MKLPAALAAVVLLISVGFASAQQAAPSTHLLDKWSGLFFECWIDPEFAAPADICDRIRAEIARQAASTKIKLIVLASHESLDEKIAKARVAGIDDKTAIEMTIYLETSRNVRPALGAVAHCLVGHRCDWPSGLDRQIYNRYEKFDPAADWTQEILPTAKRLLQDFFEIYNAPTSTNK